MKKFLKKVVEALHKIATSDPVVSVMAYLSSWSKKRTIMLTIGLVVVDYQTLILTGQRLWVSHGTDRAALGVVFTLALLVGVILYFRWMERAFREMRKQ